MEQTFAPEWLSIRQIADLTQLSYWTVLRAIQAEELKATKFGHSWRVQVEDYDSWTGKRPIDREEPTNVG